MGADLSNRSTIRKALAALFEPLTGESGSVQAVYDYAASDFDGQTPVIVVTSGAATRVGNTYQGIDSEFDFGVLLFVLYSDTEDGGTWTEEDSEDRLDLIEKQVADILADNEGTELWDDLTREDTQTDMVVVGGQAYRREIIPVHVRI